MTEPHAPMAADAAHPTQPPVVPEEETRPPASSGTPDPYLELISQAAARKDVDVVDRLIAAKERVEASRASIAFAEAFSDLQVELPTIDRNGQIVIYSKKDRTEDGVREGATPIQKNRYATIDDILEAIRAPLHRHGFSIRFEYTTLPDNRVVTTAILRHRMGHSERASTIPLQHDSSGSKNNVQAGGSTMSYGRRYSLMAVLPIVSHAPEDADDDGEAAGAVRIDADQLAYVNQLLAETNSVVAKFLKTLGAGPDATTADLTVAQYKRGITLLIQKKQRAADQAKMKAAQ